MKTYIFLTGGIEGINGVVIYLDNKIKYLLKKGYRVFIICPNTGTIYVKSLEQYAHHKPFMKYYPSSYKKGVLRCYLNELQQLCRDIDENETIIETHNYNLSCWGEALAQTMNCRHIHLLVTENPKIWTDEFYRFMKFKLERYELFGMNEKTIPMLMKGWENLDISDKYFLKTPCDNTVQEGGSEFLRKSNPEVDYRICSVGRFDKPYVLPMIDQLETFCKEKNCRVQLFLIGGVYHENNLQKIQNRLRDNKHIEYVYTGFQYPVSLSLLHTMDAAIGCAGSVLTTYRAGVPTIPLDVSDFLPVGIYGVTTNSTHYKESGKKEDTLSELLTKILIEKKVVTRNLSPDYGDLTSEFDIHFAKLAASNQSKQYYNVSAVVNKGGSYKRRIKIMHVIGPRNYYFLDNMKNKVKSKILAKKDE
ncbi:MAG: hypothetical protein Q4C66_11090 [Lachnospiraceae bacterium]|nr:hypothetical protein [Lachnospiraceae bacterium]